MALWLSRMAHITTQREVEMKQQGSAINAAYNALQIAIVLQAKRDRVFHYFVRTKEFYLLCPGVSPEQVNAAGKPMLKHYEELTADDFNGVVTAVYLGEKRQHPNGWRTKRVYSLREAGKRQYRNCYFDVQE